MTIYSEFITLTDDIVLANHKRKQSNYLKYISWRWYFFLMSYAFVSFNKRLEIEMIIIFMPMSLGYQGHISSYLFLIPLQMNTSVQFSSVQSLSHVQLFVTP